MYDSPAQMTSQFLAPLSRVWDGRVDCAILAKKRFQDIADQCRAFYHGTAGFMWSESHNTKYFGGKLPTPTFQINTNKSFEYVSLVGPSLYWKNPHRKVASQKNNAKLEIEMFGDPENPYTQEVFEAEGQKEHFTKQYDKYNNQRMETYLNWSQKEYPGGTLLTHSKASIVDGLLTGMGVAWPGIHHRGDSVYTKIEHDSVDNLFIDADCNDPLWQSAGFVFRRHLQPVWQVERLFGYGAGYLANKGTRKSNEQLAREKVDGVQNTFDLMEWYECWSKVGIGPRSNNLTHQMLDHFDSQFGDEVYLCIAKDLEHPLNLPPESFFVESPESIAARLKWHTPNYGPVNEVWRDNGRWPVNPLIFHTVDNSPWPISPISQGLGELIAMNVLISTYVDMTWENRKQIIAYLQSAEIQVKAALSSSESHVLVQLNDTMHKSINEAVQILSRPTANGDILQALSMLEHNFERRVGLNELLYGESNKQVRVAADIRQRSQATSVRPAKMADDTAEWISNMSTAEMFLAAQYVQGKDLLHLMGEFNATQWDEHFRAISIDEVMLESKAFVLASDIRKPDKEVDTANIQSLQQWYLSLAQSYAQDTGDTAPLNACLHLVGEAIDMDVSGLHLPQWRPPVDEEEQERQRGRQEELEQADLNKTQSETQKNEAAALSQQVAAAKTMSESAIAPQVLGEMHHEQDLRHNEESHLLNLVQSEQIHEQGMRIKKEESKHVIRD